MVTYKMLITDIKANPWFWVRTIAKSWIEETSFELRAIGAEIKTSVVALRKFLSKK